MLYRKKNMKGFSCVIRLRIFRILNNYPSRFNTIITSLKALDESFSSRNHVRKFLRALPTKWRPKVTAIEESKDLSTLPLDELISNLKVYEVVLEKDLETSRNKKEKYKSLALKARKVLIEEEATSSDSNDEEYAMAVRDFKKFFRRRGKFVRQPHDDKRNFQKLKEDKKKKDDRRCFNEDDSKKEEICLMAFDDNEVLSDTPYYSSSSLDNESWQNEYDKLCKISLRIIYKNKQLKAKNEDLKREAYELKTRVEQLERNKEISSECKSCVNLQTKVNLLTLKLASFENSSSSLQEILEMQKPPKNKHGIGYTNDIGLPSPPFRPIIDRDFTDAKERKRTTSILGAHGAVYEEWLFGPFRPVVRTSSFHVEDTGSIPVRDSQEGSLSLPDPSPGPSGSENWDSSFEIDVLLEEWPTTAGGESAETGTSVNRPESGRVPPATHVAPRGDEAGPSNQPPQGVPYPYHPEQVIGGDSVLSIERRLLSGQTTPSPLDIYLARIDAEDLFEAKVKILQRMAELDPTGDWERRGARALDNPRTATGEESLERRLSLFSDLDQGGRGSEAFVKLRGKVFRRETPPSEGSGT
ncbi:hypothetical protein Tco_0298696 [Tanacetum coccineum]